MTQKEKRILLVDLCARLPYHLLGKDTFGKTRELKVVYPTGTIIAQEINGECCSSCGFVPYLRSMSSMTDEEKIEYNIIKCSICTEDDEDYAGFIDWLNAHHFDYRGLIPMGLALEAPKDMYNTKITCNNCEDKDYCSQSEYVKNNCYKLK